MLIRTKSITVLFVVTIQLLFAQNVVLTEVKNMLENKDQFLYSISDNPSAQYLGTLEVQGYSSNDAEVFNKIYTQAKKIGANAYTLVPFATIDGLSTEFNPSYYQLKLFYLEKDLFPNEDNEVYIINTNTKTKKITFNNIGIQLPPRSYIKKILSSEEVYTISTKKILGSSIKLKAQKNQPVQYFQVESARIKANPYGFAGINIKFGDITSLEKSYGQFLKTIYKEID